MKKFYNGIQGRIGLVGCWIFIGISSVSAQSADLIIQLTGNNQVYSGATMSYQMVINNNGPNAANGATFMNNLPPNTSNISFAGCSAAGGAQCPSSLNISGTLVTGTIPVLPANGQVTITVSLRSPAPPPTQNSFSDTAFVYTPGGTNDPNTSSNVSIYNTTILKNLDIKTTKTVTTSNAQVGHDQVNDTLSYTIQWVNNGPSAANGAYLSEYFQIFSYGYINTGEGAHNATFSYDYKFIDLDWYASVGTSEPTAQFTGSTSTYLSETNYAYLTFTSGSTVTVPTWESGDTIKLTFKMVVMAPVHTGCGRQFSYGISNTAGASLNLPLLDTFLSNNSASVSTVVTTLAADCPVYKLDIKTTKTVTTSNAQVGHDQVNDTLSYTIQWVNNGPSAANGAYLSEYIQIFSYGYINTGEGAHNATFSYDYKFIDLDWYASAGTSEPTAQFTGSTSTYLSETNYAYLTFTSGSTVTVPTWESGDTIKLTFKMVVMAPVHTGCGRQFSYGISNTAGASLNLPLLDTFLSNNSASVSTVVTTLAADCPVYKLDIKSLNNLSVINQCNGNDTLEYTFTWINNGPNAANGASISNYFQIFNLGYTNTGNGTHNANYTHTLKFLPGTWSASPGTTLPTAQYSTSPLTLVSNSLSYAYHTFTSGSTITIPNWEAGDTIKYRLKVVDSSYVTGVGRNYSFSLNNSSSASINMPLLDTFLTNNSSTSNHIISDNGVDLTISKSLSATQLMNGDSLTMTVVVQNAPYVSTSSGVVWYDTLPNTFKINQNTLTCSASGGASCGTFTYNSTTRILTYSLAVMPANSSVTISYKGAIESLTNQSVYTGALVKSCDLEFYPNTNYGLTNYNIFGAVPVTMVNYRANWGLNEIPHVQWTTSIEENCSHFVLYRSIDGVDFQEIAVLNSKSDNGFSRSLLTYYFDDFDPNISHEPVIYYRLIQHDFDGKSEDFGILSLNRSAKQEVVVYPNPAVDYINIVSTHADMMLIDQVRVQSEKGENLIIEEKPQGETGLLTISLNNLPAGIYFVHIHSNKGIMTKKFVKTR